MKKLTLTASTLLLLFLFTSCQKEKLKDATLTSQKPNFIFILADDFGYHDMSIMGSKFYETPHIDRIAQEGMIFTNGYAACQVCSPSRASIMLGTFPARHGITDWIGAKTGENWRKKGRFNQLLPPEYVHKLPAEETTLAEAMKAGGYNTFFAGKWHLGDSTSWPEHHGFEINKGGWDAGGPSGGYFDPYKNPNLPNRKEGENLSMRLASETIDFIRQNQPAKTEKPFFAYLSFYAVHSPIQSTQEKWAKYRKKAEEIGVAENGFEMGHFLPMRQHQDNPVYAGLVEQMDDAVGEILLALDKLGLAENTIIIFTSDNGGVSAGDAYSTSNKPLRGGKGYQFEGGIREPYFIKAPGIIPVGSKNSTPVISTDFYPTILELAGMPLLPNQHKDGTSLVPLFQGKTLSERPLIWHYPHYGNQGGEPSSIIRVGEWKLIHYYEDGRKELYNLENDLSETTNIVDEHPKIVEKLNKKLFAMLKEMGARYPTKDPEWKLELEQRYLQNVKEAHLPKLEKQRKILLSPAFDPKNNWWGSAVTSD